MEASSASCHIINIFNGKVLNNASAMLLLFQGLQNWSANICSSTPFDI
jgi:hypothetical protein